MLKLLTVVRQSVDGQMYYSARGRLSDKGIICPPVSAKLKTHPPCSCSSMKTFQFQLELVKPEGCDQEVWDLLGECWNREEQFRPNFVEISLFLKRKAMSFDAEV